MKLPANSNSSNGYYNHESGINAYIPDNSSENGHQSDLDSPTLDGDFSEYMWMENEEEFDKQVMQQLEEEALMEQCIEAMLEDEREFREYRTSYYNNQNNQNNHSQPTPTATQQQQQQQPAALITPQPWSDSSLNQSELCNEMESLRVQDHDELAKQSTLNPNAAEFIPRQRVATVSAVPIVEKAT